MATPNELVRFLVNDVRLGDVTGNAFSDLEIDGYLELEGGNVKRAAAQAIDTIADNEALASKVYRSQDVGTDGAKIADALRKRATALRAQADADDEAADDSSYFGLVNFAGPHRRGPELTERRY